MWLARVWLAGAWLASAWLAGAWLSHVWLAGAWLAGAWLAGGAHRIVEEHGALSDGLGCEEPALAATGVLLVLDLDDVVAVRAPDRAGVLDLVPEEVQVLGHFVPQQLVGELHVGRPSRGGLEPARGGHGSEALIAESVCLREA